MPKHLLVHDQIRDDLQLYRTARTGRRDDRSVLRPAHPNLLHFRQLLLLPANLLRRRRHNRPQTGPIQSVLLRRHHRHFRHLLRKDRFLRGLLLDAGKVEGAFLLLPPRLRNHLRHNPPVRRFQFRFQRDRRFRWDFPLALLWPHDAPFRRGDGHRRRRHRFLARRRQVLLVDDQPVVDDVRDDQFGALRLGRPVAIGASAGRGRFLLAGRPTHVEDSGRAVPSVRGGQWPLEATSLNAEQRFGRGFRHCLLENHFRRAPQRRRRNEASGQLAERARLVRDVDLVVGCDLELELWRRCGHRRWLQLGHVMIVVHFRRELRRERGQRLGGRFQQRGGIALERRAGWRWGQV
uniref:(northern house mosquito) hypothetical protein n=1 Tax=Culex pipiens TaxID=7175 RepID=A0A8D8BFB5_CULPI